MSRRYARLLFSILLTCSVVGIATSSRRDRSLSSHANRLFSKDADAKSFGESLDCVSAYNVGMANAVASEVIQDSRYIPNVRAECFYWLMKNAVHERMSLTDLLELPWFDSRWILDGGCSVGIGSLRDTWNDPTEGVCFCYLKCDFLPRNGRECTLKIYPLSCLELREHATRDEEAPDTIQDATIQAVYLEP